MATDQTPTNKPMIKFSEVNKWYGTHHVLQNISLEVAKGEVVVVCGPSGSGKSTLIRCVNGLEKFQKGELLVDSISVTETAKLRQLRMELGFVFQQFNLYPHMTALENVTLASIHVRKLAKKEALSRGRQLLEKVGLGDKFDAYPHQLSGGQTYPLRLSAGEYTRLFQAVVSPTRGWLMSETAPVRTSPSRPKGVDSGCWQ